MTNIKTAPMGHTASDCTKFYAKANDSQGYYYETSKVGTEAGAMRAAKKIAKEQGDVKSITVMGLSRNHKVWTEITRVEI